MNIVHVVEAWKGGIASYVESLIHDQVARGYKVHVLADVSELAEDKRDLGVSVIGYNSSRNPIRFFKISNDLSEKIEKLDADVVHCHSSFPGIYVRLRRHDAKVVYTPHSWSFFKSDVNFFIRATYKKVEKFFSKRCDKIICMSKEEIDAAIDLKIPKNKLVLVYTGIPDLEPLSSEEEAVPFRKKKVGFFGRFDHQKGFDLVNQSAPLLNQNVEFHLFGGVVRSVINDLHPSLINHGWVGHNLINEKMSDMDVIVIPSRWEGFSLTPLEAMRAGKAVIVSGYSSLPEVVIHGYNGIVLQDYSAECLAQSINDISLDDCQRMGVNGRSVFNSLFSSDSFFNKIDNVYNE